ncbi:MAG TPA: MAPEG family protein [Alteraurantiacibacter sp.]|jgi:hypothetical protein
MQAQILAPAAVLVAWTLVMLVWMTVTRLSGLKKHGVDVKPSKPGGRGQNLEGVLPDEINWKAHNYAHLVEQPTLFYAVVIILAIIGPSAEDTLLAWAYVALRIVHSLWQATVNRIPIRLGLFALGTIVLAALTIRAVLVTLVPDPGAFL